MRVTCLHTADSNIEVYERADRPAGVRLAHRVRDDLLAAAERAGGLTDEIARQAVAALLEAAQGSDAVLLTCSTLGPVAAEAHRQCAVPVLRADAALAEAAVAAGGHIAVLCAISTTLEPTRNLFEAAALGSSARISVQLVEGAWAAFRKGDSEAYFGMLAKAADGAHDEGAQTLVLAQSSMAPAVQLCERARPLTSPASSLAAAITAAARA